MKKIQFTVIALAYVITPILAQNHENIYEVGSLDLNNNIYQIVVDDDLAFFACMDNHMRGGCLMILDISDLKQPQRVSVHAIEGVGLGIDKSDDLVFVACRDGAHIDDPPQRGGGLYVFDVSNPENPVVISYMEAQCTRVVIENQSVFLSCGETGLKIVDVSDPENPQLITTYDTEGNTKEVLIEAGIAYVADGDNGLIILDVSDIRRIHEVSSIQFEGNITSLAKHDETIILAEYRSAVKIVDVSELDQPEVIDEIVIETDLQNITIDENYIYASNGSDGLQMFDLENHSLVGFYDTIAHCRFAQYAVECIFAADREFFTIYKYRVGWGETRIHFSSGWNLVSLNVIPSQEYWGRGVDQIMMDLPVEIVKDPIGRFWLPAFNFNNIPFWNTSYGYFVKAEESFNYHWFGEKISPNEEIALHEGWNTIAY